MKASLQLSEWQLFVLSEEPRGCVSNVQRSGLDTTVQFHAVQELLALFDMDDTDSLGSDQQQLFLALSKEASSGTEGPRTMKVASSIQGKDITILVDSGSSHTFVSQLLADQLSGVQELQHPTQVMVANGGILHCSMGISGALWFMDGVEFQSALRIIPLQHYDMILGMDWLDEFSPMKVHWKHKWMSIPYKGDTMLIQGACHTPLDQLVIQVCTLDVPATVPMQECSAPLAQLLEEFVAIFEPPTSLPPEWQCDHSIPLVPGAQPVRIRPYRYPPALKDEIERQVAEMLQKGIIQPSFSAFSSPILLVKKKDGSWRFCVDYRHLNALTVKSSFPIPVFDELIDELARAKWFSTLDLNYGYHQIRLKKGEEFKTAFKRISVISSSRS